MSEWAEGSFILFDNGNHYDHPQSRAAEFAYDEDTMTVKRKWEVFESSGAYVSAMGDAIRIGDDEVGVSWASLGKIEQVDRDGEQLWEAAVEMGNFTGRIEVLQELQFD